MKVVFRQRAAILVGAIVGLIVGSVIGFAVTRDSAQAASDVWVSFDVAVPVTKVTADKQSVNDSPEPIDREAGDPCYWRDVLASEDIPANTIETRGITDHIVITDASGGIVATSPLTGTIGSVNEFNVACVISVDVSVPESMAYTVRIEDRYVMTLDAEGMSDSGDDRPTVFYPF